MAKQQKYEFTDEFKHLSRFVKLRRIRAVMDIPEQGVKQGDLGGWIQKVSNLPRDNQAWVADDAMVYGDAVITDSSRVEKKAIVSGKCIIAGKSVVSGRAELHDRVNITDSNVSTDVKLTGVIDVTNSKLGGNTEIEGDVEISDSRIITEKVTINGFVKITNSNIRLAHSYIGDRAQIIDSTIGSGQRYDRKLTICGNALIRNATVRSTRDVWIGEDAQVLDHADVSGHEITIKGMAIVKGYAHVGLHTTIDEFAVLDGGMKKPKYNNSFFGKTLSGDDVYMFEKTS